MAPVWPGSKQLLTGAKNCRCSRLHCTPAQDAPGVPFDLVGALGFVTVTKSGFVTVTFFVVAPVNHRQLARIHVLPFAQCSVMRVVGTTALVQAMQIARLTATWGIYAGHWKPPFSSPSRYWPGISTRQLLRQVNHCCAGHVARGFAGGGVGFLRCHHQSVHHRGCAVLCHFTPV